MISKSENNIKVYVQYQGIILTGKYFGIEDNFILIKVDGHDTINHFNLHSVVKLESIKDDLNNDNQLSLL